MILVIILKNIPSGIRKNPPGKRPLRKKSPKKIFPRKITPSNYAPQKINLWKKATQENCFPDQRPAEILFARFLLLLTLSYRCSF